MPRIVVGAMLAAALVVGCAPMQPKESAKAGDHRAAPAKCSACHLPPREHSLATERWERYLKNHNRRLRLSDEERVFLYDFLVGGTPPAAASSAPQGEPQKGK